jgi:hypothetical protein
MPQRRQWVALGAGEICCLGKFPGRQALNAVTVTSRASVVCVNGRFYEGFCQAPLNSDVQWFSGLSSPCAVVVMSLSMIRLQVLACR